VGLRRFCFFSSAQFAPVGLERQRKNEITTPDNGVAAPYHGGIHLPAVTVTSAVSYFLKFQPAAPGK
jgi:hypothetical protein